MLAASFSGRRGSRRFRASRRSGGGGGARLPHEKDVVHGLSGRLAAHHHGRRRQVQRGGLAADVRLRVRRRPARLRARPGRCCTRGTSTRRADEPSRPPRPATAPVLRTPCGRSARSPRDRRAPPRRPGRRILGEAVAVLVGHRREPMEPGRELNLHPQLRRPAATGLVEVRLGGRLTNDLRTTGQPPALRADAGDDVLEPIGAGDVLAGEQLDEGRQRERVRPLLGGQRRPANRAGQRVEDDGARRRDERRPAACPDRPRPPAAGSAFMKFAW